MYVALLGGAAAVGDVSLAQQLYAQMAERQIPPNQATFCALFQCVAAAGAAWHRRRFGPPDAESAASQLQPEQKHSFGSSSGGDAETEPASSSLSDVAGGGYAAAASDPLYDAAGGAGAAQPAAPGAAMDADDQDSFMQQHLYLQERQVQTCLYVLRCF